MTANVSMENQEEFWLFGYGYAYQIHVLCAPLTAFQKPDMEAPTTLR
jgi:hypothetical protein